MTNKMATWFKWEWRNRGLRRCRTQVGWTVRAMIAFTFMLTGFSLWALPTQFALDHQWFTLAVAADMLFMSLAFIAARRRESGPNHVGSLRSLVIAVIGRRTNSDGWGEWKLFQLVNFSIVVFYVVVAKWVAWVGDEWLTWSHVNREQINTGIIGFLGVVAIIVSLSFAFLAIRGVVRFFIRAKRAADQEVLRLMCELRTANGSIERSNTAIQGLIAVRDATAPVIAEAIVRLRESKRGGAGGKEIMRVRQMLEAQLTVLMPDDTRRNAILECARRKVKSDEQPVPATPANPAT